jgi:hypothetical protein
MAGYGMMSRVPFLAEAMIFPFATAVFSPDFQTHSKFYSADSGKSFPR